MGFKHYFISSKNAKIFKIKIDLDISFEIFSASGLFSSKKLDKGTEVLLRHLFLKPNWKILDLGCGCGIIGIYAKLKYPTLKVFSVDVNKLAVKVTKMNVKKFNLQDFYVVLSDGKDNLKERDFDAVFLNPPMAAGMKIVEKLIKDAHDVLKPKAILELVVRWNKGGRTVKKILEQNFENVQTIARKSGYRVFLAQK